MDLASNNLRSKIDSLMDRFYGAGVASHPTIIEQLNYLLFMRALSVKDDEYVRLGITDKDKIVFDGDLAKYKWENLLTLNAEELFTAIQECFEQIPKSTTNDTVRLVFRNAHLKLYDKPTLRIVVHELEEFAGSMDKLNQSGQRDIFGDMYEYLLSKLAQAGTSGQFRTPRHIIEFIIAVVAPKKGETILDPAVGTAGFLVKAFEYLQKEYTSSEFAATGGTFDKLNGKEQSFLYEHTFSGFDSDEDMIKFGMMNLYLHGLENARMLRQNTLTDTAGNRDKYDVIVANPPFAGKIDRDSVTSELQMNTGATEVLFLRYMLEHLTTSGRAGVIVPEGVLFNSSGAHTKIRQLLLENGLWCVVSLPAGVFNPYAGVKTSIVFFDKSRASKKEVLFAKIEHDGFSIGAQRRPITKNDLPEILADIKRYHAGEELQQPKAHVVTRDRIAETKDHNLSGDRYKIIEKSGSQKWPMLRLIELCEIKNGLWKGKKEPFVTANVIRNTNFSKQQTLDLTDVAMLEVESKQLESRMLEQGDIIIENSGGGPKQPVGRVVYFNVTNSDIPFSYSNFTSRIRVTNKAETDSKYLWYIFRHLHETGFTEVFQNQTSGIRNLDKTAYLESTVPLPPIDVQKEIVAELDGYQKIIDGARQVVENYKPTIKIEASWPIEQLGNHADILSGYAFKSDFFNDTGKGMPLIRIRDVKPSRTKTYYSGEYDKRFIVNDGDLLVGMDGEFNPTIWIGGTALLNQRVCRVENFKRVVPGYIIQVLRDELKDIEGTTYAVTVKHISSKQIKEILIPVPPIEEQQRIVASLKEEQELINASKKLIRIYEQKIKDKITEVWG